MAGTRLKPWKGLLEGRADPAERRRWGCKKCSRTFVAFGKLKMHAKHKHKTPGAHLASRLRWRAPPPSPRPFPLPCPLALQRSERVPQAGAVVPRGRPLDLPRRRLQQGLCRRADRAEATTSAKQPTPCPTSACRTKRAGRRASWSTAWRTSSGSTRTSRPARTSRSSARAGRSAAVR